jgi:hypothetical protein
MVNELYNVIFNVGLLCLPVILLYKFNTSKKLIKNEDNDCDSNDVNDDVNDDVSDVSDDVSDVSDDVSDVSDDVSECSNVTNNTSNIESDSIQGCSNDIVMESILQENEIKESKEDEIGDEIANKFAEEFLTQLELRKEFQSNSQCEIDKKIKAILDDF